MRRRKPEKRSRQSDTQMPPNMVDQSAMPIPQQTAPQNEVAPQTGRVDSAPRKKRRRAPQQALSRSERQRRQIRRSKRQKITRRIAFLVLTFGMAFLAVTVFFRVEKLQVTGTKHYSAEEIGKTLGIEQGDNLFSFRINALEKKVMKQYPYLSTVTIKRKLPDVLSVQAVDSVPAVAIDLSAGGYFLADEHGKLLEQAAAVPDKVAPVTGVVIEKAEPGKYLKGESKSETLVKLTKALAEAGMLKDVDFINVSASYDIRFGYLGRLDVRLGKAVDLTEKLRMLGIVVNEKLSATDFNIVYLSDPSTAYCPQTTKEQIEQSMLPLEDIIPLGGASEKDE